MKCLRIVDRLPESLEETVVEELARGGLWTAFSLQTPGGRKAIDSPYEPRGEARRTLLRAECRKGHPTLVLGAGSGFFSHVIIEEQFTPALLVTCSRALLDANDRRLRKQLPDSDQSVTLVADDDPNRVWTTEILPFLSECPDAVVVHHPRERRAFPGFFGALEISAARWEEGSEPAKTALPVIEKVLFVGAGGLFERELREEFRRRNIALNRIPQTDLRGLDARLAIRLLREHKPDLVLSIDNRGSDEYGLLPEACEQSGIAWATWLLDDPRFLLRADELSAAGRQRIGFCWDHNGVDGWRECGFEHATLLPLATDETLFEPGQGVDDLRGRIIFAGSPRFASGENYFAALDKIESARRIAGELAETIQANRRPPDPERLAELLQTHDDHQRLDPEARRRLRGYAVQQANQAYRARYLNALADLKPVVIGAGWEGLLDDRIELRRPLDFYTQLPRLYKTDAVHLSLTNLQMRSHPNQRPFDVGACGNAVLNDALEALPELFGEELAGAIMFRDPSEMVDKADSLIRDAERRAELGRELRRVVLESHTVRHRVDRILQECGERPKAGA